MPFSENELVIGSREQPGPVLDRTGATIVVMEHKKESRKLSLYPLDFETALEAALKVEPPPKPARKGRVKKAKPDDKESAK